MAIVAVLSCPQFIVAGSAIAGPTQAQVAYDGCTNAYNSKRQGLTTAWAFVSGVNGTQNQCYWGYGYGSTQDAVNSATNDCKKDYSDCFTYATSDGWSDWVTRISNAGGTDPNNTPDVQVNNNPTTPQCKLELFKAGLGLGAGVVALLTHRDFTPPDVDASQCAGQ
jgi:hypothetical protein